MFYTDEFARAHADVAQKSRIQRYVARAAVEPAAAIGVRYGFGLPLLDLQARNKATAQRFRKRKPLLPGSPLQPNENGVVEIGNDEVGHGIFLLFIICHPEMQ